jgi:tryptophan 7-halogenase
MDKSKVNRIVVLGGGSAGFLAALGIKKRLAGAEVVVVRSTKIGVVGVGEGTIPSVMQYLHRYLGFDRFELYSDVLASPKLGIHYLWGPRPYFNYSFTGQLTRPHQALPHPRGYYCADDFSAADLNSSMMNADKMCIRMPNGKIRFNANHAYHLQNARFVDFLERKADEFGIEKIDAILQDVVQDESGIKSLVLDNGQTVSADLFVDASGFRAELIGQVFNEPFVDFSNALYCDSAVVGGWERTTETYHPYTTAETMNAGWCWRIEHDDLVNRGYVFSSKFLSEDEAVAEYKEKNPLANVVKVIRFRSGVYRRSWVKNVVAIGNSLGFVEPLEATAIGMICDSVVRLVAALRSSGREILELQQRLYNEATYENWIIIRDFLAMHYKFNSRIDSPFWRAAMADVEVGDAQLYVDYYKQVGPDFSMLDTQLKRDFFSAEGYLVMLLGQQVPFKRQIDISKAEQDQWKKFRNNLDVQISAGIDVPQFLEIARSDDPRDYFARDATLEMDARQHFVENEKVGQLNWH